MAMIREFKQPVVERLYTQCVNIDIKNSNIDIYSVGDKIIIPLGELGTFTATAQKVTDSGVLLIFDDCVASRSMNEKDTNIGGYDASDLKKWIDTDLYAMFPEAIKQRMSGLSLPNAGELWGWYDAWNVHYIVGDDEDQLILMKQRRNRVSYYDNDCTSFWLRNAIKHQFSFASFSVINNSGNVDFYNAAAKIGVRPEFWLI